MIDSTAPRRGSGRFALTGLALAFVATIATSWSQETTPAAPPATPPVVEPAKTPAPTEAPKAAEPPRPTSAAPLTETQVVERVTTAVDRAVAYLASKQNRDGSWHTNHAPNALSILAILGAGHTPGRGRYADEIERAKKFILATQTDKGLFVSPAPSHGPMYEHALATLACAELYGMDTDPALEEHLRQAVKLIVSAQNPNGGWRYEPAPGDHDLSVTAMQIIALRAARNAEISVPEQTFRKAIDYVRSCAHHDGGFGYLPGGAPNPQMSAAGTLSLQLLGAYDDEHVARTLDGFAELPVEWRGGAVNYFYYFHYYAAQTHYQAGGKHWNEWRPQIRNLLIEHQNADGSWDVPPNTAEVVETVGPRKIYWTAMASLVLEVYMHYLPAYQR